MRKPETVERLYLDFDGFFASVEQLANKALQGRPVGVVPFAGAEEAGTLIACSREAKIAGVKSVMRVAEAKIQCPDLILVPQSPHLYRRAHNMLMAEISSVIPPDAIKSIDEVTCKLDTKQQANPRQVVQQIKQRLKKEVGPAITCSVGVAANRLLAKMACKAGKIPQAGSYGDGCTIWPPDIMPSPLILLPLNSVPGIGMRMALRLEQKYHISTMAALLATAPKQLRQIWSNVSGERLWYALHGYDIQARPQARRMYGHGRVLPPDHRNAVKAREASRLLLVKAARRLRRAQSRAGKLWLYLSLEQGGWQNTWALPQAQDDHTLLSALEQLWQLAIPVVKRQRIFKLHIALFELSPLCHYQLNMLDDPGENREKWEQASQAIDQLNKRFGRTLISLGSWQPPEGGYAGGKISYTRIPQAEDFL